MSICRCKISILFESEKALSSTSFHLASCIFGVMHPTNNGLKNLLSLALDTVETDQTQIECLRNKYCKHLEWLRLMHIEGVKVVKIDGSSSSLALKYVEVKSCPHLRRIGIHGTTQLYTFEYTGKMLKFSFLDLPKLKNVSFFYKPDHFPLQTQLETFTLSTSAVYFKVNKFFPLCINMFYFYFFPSLYIDKSTFDDN